MKRVTIILYFAITLTVFAWLKMGRQLIFKPAPPNIMRYNTSTNWQDEGYPHERGPKFIDQHSVWSFGMYGTDYKGTKNGFIRFNLETGNADMLWPFSGNSRYARIIAFKKHHSGKIAVVWKPQLKKQLMLSILKPTGGIQQLGTIPIKGKWKTVLGLEWKDLYPTIAFGSFHQKKTTILSLKALNIWKTNVISWKSHFPKRTIPHLALFQKGKWTTIVSDWILKSPDKPRKCRIYSVTEGKRKPVLIGAVRVTARDTPNMIDGSCANLTKGFYYFNKSLYFYRDKQLIQYNKPTKKSDLLLETYKSTQYVTTNKQLSRVIYLRNKNNTDLQILFKNRKIAISYKRSPEARKRRKTMTVSINRHTNTTPIVESFRFAGSALVPVITKNNEIWLLGTFGHYIKIDHNGNRTDTPSPFSRFFQLIQRFSNRSGVYNDFFNEVQWLKIAALLFPLFGLPLFLLFLKLLHFIPFFQKDLLTRLKEKGILTLIMIILISGWWFWNIITEI